MKKTLLVSAAILLGVGNAYAVPITIEFDYRIQYEFDWITFSFTPMEAEKEYGQGSITFENTFEYTKDMGLSTVSKSGETPVYNWRTSLNLQLLENPYPVVPVEYYSVSTETFDAPWLFQEKASLSAKTKAQSNCGDSWATSINIQANRFSSARSGIGESDYALTGQAHIDYWKSFISSGETIYFTQDFSFYNTNTEINSYWYGTATVTDVYEHQPVPEPATMLLFGMGLGVLSWIQRRRHV